MLECCVDIMFLRMDGVVLSRILWLLSFTLDIVNGQCISPRILFYLPTITHLLLKLSHQLPMQSVTFDFNLHFASAKRVNNSKVNRSKT